MYDDDNNDLKKNTKKVPRLGALAHQDRCTEY